MPTRRGGPLGESLELHLRREAAVAVRLARLRQPRPDRQVCPSRSLRPRPGSSTRTRWRRSPSTCCRPRPTRRTRPSTRTSPVAATSSSTTRTGSGSRPRPTTSTSSRQGDDGHALELQRDYDLTSVLDEDSERITSALPDFDGLIWFVSKANGKVGTLDPKTGELKVLELGEEIENSFAIGENGVYIVSDKRMYRFEANDNGKPRIVWKKPLRELRDRQAEPGQRRLGHDADDHGQRLRRDHRQRRPEDERRRLPDRRQAARREARGLPRCRSSRRARAPPRTR